ncbi:MAG: hypothetical protein Q4B42_00875 [Oscillospiraceae bacterium]|nr:hypothetical protein [Oscillospiraceae bacterium]
MDKLKVLFLMGPADCNDPNIPRYSEEFLKELSAECGFEIVCAPLEEVAAQELPVFFIASGGSEQGFKNAYKAVKPPYMLLTTPAYNSLAAAMEILGYLDENEKKGEILHGSLSRIAARLKTLRRAAEAIRRVRGMRLGAIGEPSGLIASDADAAALKRACGMELIDLDLKELVEEYKKGGYPENEYTKALENSGYDINEVKKALNVYGAAKRMVGKYGLQAVTVRCFDLLNLIGTTGCLALAILNAEGIPAACEGDKKSMISMAVAAAVTGGDSFMANPSCMDPDTGEIIFAHCTLPIDMPDSYTLTTHFESGIGVAVSGDLEPCEMTIFKCNGDLSRWYADRAELIETTHRDDLCRTQMRLRLSRGTEYFERSPISNHHMLLRGDWTAELAEFFALLKSGDN